MDGKYDPQKRSRADKAALLRAVVAAYIGYLGYKIAAAENTTMSLLTARIIGIAFILAAAGFCVYIFRRWKSDCRDALIAKEEQKAEDE